MNHILILKAKNIMSGNKMGNLKACGLFSLLLCFYLAAFFGCATAKVSDKGSLKPQEVTAITGIDIQDREVTITADRPFIYTIYKPGDPYKIVVDLPDVTTGAFDKKLVSNKAGIVEIVPSQIKSPSPMARLEVLLQTPSLVDQEYKNNTLKIKIKEDLPAKKDEMPSSKRGLSKVANVSDLPRDEKDSSTSKIKRDSDPPIQPTPSKATEITDISFDASADAVKILIKGNGTMTPNVFPLDSRIVIDIADVTLNAAIPAGVISPVKGIRSGKHDDKVRLVIDLREKTTFDVTSIGDTIAVTFKRPWKEPSDVSATRMIGERTEAQTESATEKPEPEVPAGSKCGAYLEGKENVNFDFQDQDIVPILRLFADISGCNLFVHPDVKGRATMKFRDVPWNQAFDTILKTFSLGKSIEGSIIRVAPLTVFAKESDEKAKATEAGVRAEPMETKIYPISYADVAAVEAAIKNSKILTPRGSMNVDKRTSTLFVKDVPSVFPQVDGLLSTLDISTPQVSIEARIVQITSTDVRDLGISWGVNLNATNTLASLSGFHTLGTGAFTGKNFIVDLPSGASSAGSGSGMSFGIMNPSKTFGLDLQLDALEKMSKAKIIANPKIVTVDNEKAKIEQGTSEPYPVLTSEGTISTAYKDVVLSTEITPHITPNGSVGMHLHVTKEDILGTVNIGGSQVPRTSKIQSDANVLVQNGETLVIGGIYTKTTRNATSGVPGLMKIPILGWLFKNREVQEDTGELLIFITPRIMGKL